MLRNIALRGRSRNNSICQRERVRKNENYTEEGREDVIECRSVDDKREGVYHAQSQFIVLL